MTSYRQTAYNDFETPSGAIGEAPDGPGAFQHVMDQVDARIGIGGSEYAGGGVAAIPSSRLFIGKLAYWPAGDIVYRYVGTGNTPIGGTSAWQGWQKPPTPYTPTFTNLAGSNSVTALWGISAGIAWATIQVISGSGYSITSGTDVTATIPTPILAGHTNGRGSYYRGGVTSNGSVIDLAVLAPGTLSSIGSFRIRANVQSGTTAGAWISQNQLANAIPSPYTGDQFQIEVRSPSALVA